MPGLPASMKERRQVTRAAAITLKSCHITSSTQTAVVGADSSRALPPQGRQSVQGCARAGSPSCGARGRCHRLQSGAVCRHKLVAICRLQAQLGWPAYLEACKYTHARRIFSLPARCTAHPLANQQPAPSTHRPLRRARRRPHLRPSPRRSHTASRLHESDGWMVQLRMQRVLSGWRSNRASHTSW